MVVEILFAVVVTGVSSAGAGISSHRSGFLVTQRGCILHVFWPPKGQDVLSVGLAALL